MNEEERRGLANKFAKRFLDNLEERELCRKVNEIIDENIMLHSIIKEVRKYIEDYINQFNGVYPVADMRYLDLNKILEILDKINKENNNE